jgi:uncharacterized protein YacL
MLFFELFRLVFVLLGAVAGYEAGRGVDASAAPVVGMVLGALVFYVVGGVVGRFLRREEPRALAQFERVPPGELFAGALTAVAGLLLGVALCLPLFALTHRSVVYPVITLVAWTFAWFGFRIGVVKGRQVVAAAGLSRILAPPNEPLPGYALLVDTSAVMDRSLLVLGQGGLLAGGLVVPRFVVDQVQAQANAPDPVTQRRARRGLEALEALREGGVTVHVAPNELPEVEDLEDRLLEMARRLGLRLATCSPFTLAHAQRRHLAATDLRQLVRDLMPEHPAGERLMVDLERAGTQARQAVGYLDDGDMVVVNDAAHLIGTDQVAVEVQATRPTSQGLLVFARLLDGGPGALDGVPPAAERR